MSPKTKFGVVECTLQNICILMCLPSYSCQMNMKEEFYHLPLKEFILASLFKKKVQREKWFDHDPTHAGKDLYRSLKSTLVDTTLLIRRKYSNDMEHENTH